MQEKQYHDELKMEIEGTTFSNLSNKKADSTPDDVDKDETQAAIEQAVKDADNIATSLMSRKKQGLLQAMQVHVLLPCSYCHYSLIEINIVLFCLFKI